jgi:two-component system OmpR family response regulator
MSERKKILVFDDSPMVLDVTRFALERAGYQVAIARTLAELEHEQERFAADLLLIDIQTPEAMGDDVAMVLRAVRGIKAPIFLFSSLEERELAQRARDAEIDGYISKWIGVEAVVARVQEILTGGHG